MSSPYAAMSTSGQGAVLDRMDTTSHPSPGSQGDEPPPPPGPRDEAGAADGGNRPGPSHGDHQSGSSSSSTSASTASIQGEEDPGAAGVLSGTPQQELEQAHPRPTIQPEEATNMQLQAGRAISGHQEGGRERVEAVASSLNGRWDAEIGEGRCAATGQFSAFFGPLIAS